MTNKEIAERLRGIFDHDNFLSGKARATINELANELDPPRPEPGLVTYQGIHDEEPAAGWWDGKKLRDYATGRVFAETALDTLNMKPARILADDEVAIAKPSTDIWPSTKSQGKAKRAQLVWHFYDKDGACFSHMTAKHGSFTRAEAEARAERR